VYGRQICRSSARLGVFRLLQEKGLSDCIQPRRKTNKEGLIVWGCFWGKQRGLLVLIREALVDRHVYIRLLDAHLGPIMQEIADEVGDPQFQQHKA